MSPEEILAGAQQEVDGLGIATVYRNIKALLEEGVLSAVEMPGQPARYELAGKAHHHHFHCTGCDKVFDLPGCVGGIGKTIPPGFEITGHDVLLYGKCRACRAARTRPKRRTAH